MHGLQVQDGLVRSICSSAYYPLRTRRSMLVFGRPHVGSTTYGISVVSGLWTTSGRPAVYLVPFAGTCYTASVPLGV